MNINCIEYKVSGMQSNHRKVWHKSFHHLKKNNWECYLTMILETVFGGFHWWGAMKSQDFSISWWFSESSISADTEPISKFLDALERWDPNSFISGTFDHPGRCYHTTHLPFVRAIFAKMSARHPTLGGSPDPPYNPKFGKTFFPSFVFELNLIKIDRGLFYRLENLFTFIFHHRKIFSSS